jgi:hypothetical protein
VAVDNYVGLCNSSIKSLAKLFHVVRCRFDAFSEYLLTEPKMTMLKQKVTCLLLSVHQINCSGEKDLMEQNKKTLNLAD